MLLRTHFNKLDMKQKETFKILLLNENNEVIKISNISEGDENSCIVEARGMFKEILINDAASVAICHNHCSKNLTPSQDDIIQTRNIQSICDFLDIRFLGHFIINSGAYYYMQPY